MYRLPQSMNAVARSASTHHVLCVSSGFGLVGAPPVCSGHPAIHYTSYQLTSKLDGLAASAFELA